MKKFSLLAAGALAVMAMASCDEFELPYPQPGQNEQEPVFNAADLKVDNAAAATIDLPALYESGSSVLLAKETVTGLPSTSSLKLVMEIASDEAFTTTGDVETAINAEGEVRCMVNDLQAAFTTVIARGLDTKTVYARYRAYAVNGKESARIGGPDVYYGNCQLTITPVLLTHVIENEYYLVGTFCDWDVTKAVKMTKVDEGNPYDFPDFIVNFEVTDADIADGFGIKVVPASAVAAGTYAGAYGFEPVLDDKGEATMEGGLIASPEAETAAATVKDPGSYQLSVNMYDLTYKISLAYEYLYVNANGWYTDFERMLRLSTSNYVNYDGVARINHTFNFLCQPSFAAGVGYGADGEVTTKEDGTYEGSMALSTDLSKLPKVNIPGNQLFYLTANLLTLKWTAAPINKISLVGAFNEWSTTDANAEMKASNRNTVWTIQNVQLEGEFKFCVNNGWALSFGGAMDNIVQNGANLKTEAGTYDVTLDFTTLPYTCKLVKK